MDRRRLISTTASISGIVASCLLLVSLRGQTAAHAVSQPSGDTPYHSTDMTKPDEAGRSIPSKENPAPAKSTKAASLGTLAKIEILPSSISIEGPRYSQRLIVEGTFIDGHKEELSSRATLSSSNLKVARVDKDDLVAPQGDGTGTITALVAGHKAVASVTVNDYGTATTWSFRNDVLPVMTKVGCNSGPCHGAAAGKKWIQAYIARL